MSKDNAPLSLAGGRAAPADSPLSDVSEIAFEDIQGEAISAAGSSGRAGSPYASGRTRNNPDGPSL